MNHKSITISSEMHKLLESLNDTGTKTIDELAEILKIPRGKIELLSFQLSQKGLVKREEKFLKQSEITNEGKSIIKFGLPENRLIKVLENSINGLQLNQLSTSFGLTKQEVNVAIGQLRKANSININKGIVILIKKIEVLNEDLENTLKSLVKNPFTSIPKEIVDQLLNRGFIEIKEKLLVTLEITAFGKEIIPKVQIIETVSKLTPDHIRSGEWRSLQLKRFKIDTEAKSIPMGKKHPYLSFLEEVKIKLLGLGFSEMRGPLVETEFWNFDALFQAQDHPAREWSDVYTIKEPTHGQLPKDEKLVEAIKRVHETGEPVGSRGWRYKWNPQKSARLLLRPQGTAISARTLYNLEIPSKYFSIARCYRPDSVDATHLSEFNQLEGIVCDPSITFRDLLGILKTFAIEIAGANDVRFKPDYYPFTSPSVELSARHPELGFIEFGGAGIFRPEVIAPFGIPITSPVIAWGLGVDRLYMVKRKIKDIRELFTYKLDWLRSVPVI